MIGGARFPPSTVGREDPGCNVFITMDDARIS